jgi:hypothetical protein
MGAANQDGSITSDHNSSSLAKYHKTDQFATASAPLLFSAEGPFCSCSFA